MANLRKKGSYKVKAGERHMVQVFAAPHHPPWIALYVSRLMQRMNLRNWLVRVSDEPCENAKHGASMSVLYGQNVGTLQLSADFRTYTRENQRQLLVHELVHMLTNSTWQLVDHSLQELLGMPVYSIFMEAYRQTMEREVDAIAYALDSYMPLPPKPAKPPKAKEETT